MSAAPPTEVPSHHWADHAANELVERHPSKKRFVCAAGISPSGVVHIGNFREVITVDFVVRALRDLGREVRFLYSWDDYDALRKVPVNIPNQDEIAKHLRKPLASVPDPFGKATSYAAHFEKTFESEIAPLGVDPEFLYQHERYSSGMYAQGIAKALQNEKEIAAILNRARTGDLPSSWSCVTIYSKATGKDTTTVLEYLPPTSLRYRCDETKQEFTVDFSKEPGVKLLWRVDWPMRWAQESVDFEPGGKDHSSTGGSYETGAMVAREIYGVEPPHYVQYDFVLAKGVGSKLSSSTGNLISLTQALDIYEPAVLRWLFASRKPNLDFSIAFDLDVMKAYDEFDRCERYAFGAEPGEDKKVTYERRIYQLAMPKTPKLGGPSELPAQFPFRHLCTLLQTYEGDFATTAESYSDRIRTKEDRQRFQHRAERAWRWINEFAPEDFRFRVTKETDDIPQSKQPKLLLDLADTLSLSEAANWTEEELSTQVRDVGKKHGAEGKVFFQELYTVLVGKPQGPKLAPFLQSITLARAAKLFRKAAGG